MSTRIYNGIKITDQALFLKELTAYRAKLFNQYDPTVLAKIAVRHWFRESDLIHTKQLMPLRIFEEKFKKRFELNRVVYEIGYNHPFDLTINYNPESTLARVICQNTAHVNQILLFKSVEDYSYWNNEDGPENISKEEWAQRCVDWDNSLEPSGFQVDHGYAAELQIIIFEEQWNYLITDKMIEIKSKMLTDYCEQQLTQEYLCSIDYEYHTTRELTEQQRSELKAKTNKKAIEKFIHENFPSGI